MSDYYLNHLIAMSSIYIINLPEVGSSNNLLV